MFDALARGHGMVLVKGVAPTEILGCRCGWRPTPYRGDSDTQLARHIAGALATRLTEVIADVASRPQGEDLRPQGEDLWPGFTHTELSMIASHLAGGGSFCCRHNAAQRARVTSNRRKRERLATFAHEAMGCRSDRTSEDSWMRWAARYLEKFLDSVGGGR